MGRGRKRKSIINHLTAGTYRRDRHGPLPDPAPRVEDNGLEPPRRLAKRQRELWDTVIRRLPGLHPVDVGKAFMWVELQAEFEEAPQKMRASRIALIRQLAVDLEMERT